MNTNKKNNSNDYIIDNISSTLKRPIFYYDGALKYDELLENMKSRKFKPNRIILFIIRLVSLITLYFYFIKIIKVKLEFSILHAIAIIIIFTINIFLQRRSVKRSTLKLVSEMSNVTLLFYNDFLIFKNRDAIQLYFYNEVTNIMNFSYIISFNLCSKKNGNRNISLIKEKTDNNFYSFLKEKKNNPTTTDNIVKSLDFLEENITNEKYFYINDNINKELLEQFYNTFYSNKCNHRKIVFGYLLSNAVFISVLIIWIGNIVNFYSLMKWNGWYNLLYVIILTPITTACSKNNYINKYINSLVKNRTNNFEYSKFYFYDDFLLEKTDFKIKKYDYKEIEFIDNNSDYIFLKIKKINIPLILEKKKTNITDFSFLK